MYSLLIEYITEYCIFSCQIWLTYCNKITDLYRSYLKLDFIIEIIEIIFTQHECTHFVLMMVF